MEKRCIKCQQVKPLSSFCKNRARPDGHDVYCRDCRRALYIPKKSRTPRTSIEDIPTQELLDELRRRGALPQPDEQTPTQ